MGFDVLSKRRLSIKIFQDMCICTGRSVPRTRAMYEVQNRQSKRQIDISHAGPPPKWANSSKYYATWLLPQILRVIRRDPQVNRVLAWPRGRLAQERCDPDVRAKNELPTYTGSKYTVGNREQRYLTIARKRNIRFNFRLGLNQHMCSRVPHSRDMHAC